MECFECLRTRIQTDFSENLIFSYGISDSGLPFGSKSVVQAQNCSGNASSELLLVCLPSCDDDCLTKYVDEYSTEDVEKSNVDNEENVSLMQIDQDQEVCVQDHILKCYRKTSIGGMGFDNSRVRYSGKFLCTRTITALAPFAYIGTSSYSAVENVARNFVSGSPEDHILSSLNRLIEGKSTGRDGANFLKLVGMPSFDEDNVPGCIRHPNIAPVLGMLKSPGYVNLLLPKASYTLESVLHYSPNALDSEWHIRFLVYQILSALAYIHSLGISHGNLCPSSIMLTSSCWSWLSIWDKPRNLKNKEPIDCSSSDCPSQNLYADLKISPSTDWHSDFWRWWRGEMTNYDYLLALNRLAGRRWGDHTFHIVMPWVIDFSVKPDENSETGWRDLGKGKWRLAKGDEQLDFTYLTSEVPHHVSDECLSELAVCSYKARRLPLSILRTAVRSVYEPNEYPSSMQRLYQWTPDECIPEFYTDPRIFTSIHPGMSNLAVPAWANSPEDFIRLHRDALESSRVSRQIHIWIDIMFGYKMSGEAAIASKNVMLPSSDPMVARSMGRRQLFTRPHPMRQVDKLYYVEPLLIETAHLQKLEEAASFCEHAPLSPQYSYSPENIVNTVSDMSKLSFTTVQNFEGSTDVNLSNLIEFLEVNDSGSLGFQDWLLWSKKSSDMRNDYEATAVDIFSLGCILAEFYLKRPLFTSTSFEAYMDSGVLPGMLQEVPTCTLILIEACLQRDWRRRPSAKCLLDSPYFPATIRSSYLFLAPLNLIVDSQCLLQYATKFARQGALKVMGSFAAEMCASYCLPLVLISLSDSEAESALFLLQEFLKCLTPQAIKTLILPTIQKILQAPDYSHLKVSLLQDSFVRDLWTRLGKQAYMEVIHPLVISNLSVSPHKNSASAASVLLIGSSEELGIPVTIHQTILPLIHCFGKGLCADGVDVLVRIGGLLGENFIVRQLIPLLRNVVLSCISISNIDKPEPMQSWSALAVIDCLITLHGLVAFLQRELLVKELVQDRSCVHIKVLMQRHLDFQVLQVAATTLIELCQQMGPDSTTLYVMPQLKELFDELAFSEETSTGSSSFGRSIKITKPKLDESQVQMESRMDLVLLLYPSFASILGIEKLRQCCTTWLLLEQFLQRSHNWKWEHVGEASRTGIDNLNAQRPTFSKPSASDSNPTKLLLNGVGWSIPQSQGVRGSKNLMSYKQSGDFHRTLVVKKAATSNFGKREPWFWFPSPAVSWDGLDFSGRYGGLKDELPWRIRASIIYSVRAHPGALRCLAVCHDESTVFTGGVGPGFKGTVQKWGLPRMDCVSGYYGHEEVVNDICVLSSSGRIASCDGTIHVWNCQTGKLIASHAEPSTGSAHLNTLSSVSKVNSDHSNILNSDTLSGGILSSTFGGSLYTCMHHLEYVDKLVAGTGNGSIRFIDVVQDQKLHLWKSESVESFSSLVSALCSCGSDKIQEYRAASSPSWIAAGLSSGHCRLLDARSGTIVAYWRAHDGYITKLAAPEDHLLVSSSLDKTLRVWDLRRSWSSQSNVLRGHSDGVSGFSVWGQDIISISRNKIGLSSLTRSDGHQGVSPQKLYMADRGTRNLSVLSSISILPFSRLFLVGTEDGYLKICC